MQVQLIDQKIGSVGKNKYQKSNIQTPKTEKGSSVSFTGASSPNIVVGLMDTIAAGGFAAAFIIQDGLGFILPRVGKALFRGGKKKVDENGNDVLDKNGQPKHELNWAFARKEALREVITGPSAFIIPAILLHGINKKYGRANSVRLDYIDGFKKIFTDYAKNNKDAILSGSGDKKKFYTSVFKEVLETSINSKSGAKKIEDVVGEAEKLAEKQIKIDNVLKKYDKGLWSFLYFKNNKLKNEELSQIGSVVSDFMELKKKHVGGASLHDIAELTASNGKDIKKGSIGSITEAMSNYFDDAVKTTHKALNKAKDANIDELMNKFTGKKLGSRILTNLGLWGAVALFYTQIPKIYNMGTGGKNPAVMNDELEQDVSKVSGTIKPSGKSDGNNKVMSGKDPSFGSGTSFVERLGNRVFKGSKLKEISDVFELEGPIIQGQAMAVLLYGACIPPRLWNYQDKYDLQEIIVRDSVAFTALLFGAKALNRLFSDGFTKITGLALNNKDIKGRNPAQKVWDYLNPANKRVSVLSSSQLESKYTNIQNYKDGVDGFVEFIEKSNGDIKKALSQDKDIKKAADVIVKEMKGKSFNKATKEEIKDALHLARLENTLSLDNFYKKFGKDNKLLVRAKTCNSAFDFLSTIVLVPLLIYKLTEYCEHLTEKKRAEDKRLKAMQTQSKSMPLNPTNKPTMQGFLNNGAA